MQWPFKLQKKSSISEANFINIGNHAYSINDLRSYSKDGYAQNSTIYSCIRKIATNAASVKLKVKVNDERQIGHPLETLLRRPNPDDGDKEFFIASYSWLMLTGNLFTSKTVVSGRPVELWNWQPYNIAIGHSSVNPMMPSSYIFRKGSRGQKVWDVNPITGESDILHWSLFNPSEEMPFFGQSPLSAAASSADQLNAANKWRFNGFKNDMAPSGILSTEQMIDAATHNELSKTMDRESGWKRAKRFLILGGGMKYTQLGLSAKESDWLAGSKFNKQEIAEVYGVPTQLLGIEGSQTYANYAEARLAFYNDTIIPLVELYASELNRWLAPMYGDNVEIYFDKDEIDALEPLRTERRNQKIQSGAYSINEVRAFFGDEPSSELEADQIMIDANKIPLGTETFMPSEQNYANVSKALMRAGMTQGDAEQKAFDILSCQHQE